MSTWQQELYVQVQVRVQVLQNCTSTSTSTKYASEAITISTTNCRKLKFLQSVIINLWLLRHVLGIPSVQTMIENRRRKFVGNLLNDRRPQGLVVIGVCLSVCLCALMGDVGHGQRAGLCPPRTQ